LATSDSPTPMSRQSLTSVLLLATVLGGLLGTACLSRDSQNDDGPAAEGAAPAETLALSREAFAQIDSFRATFEITGQSLGGTVTGEAGYHSTEVIYSRTLFDSDEAAADSVKEMLFIPPDLYLQQVDGSWLVMSPWYQGVPPDEQQDFYLDDPMLDYPKFTRNLADVEQQADEIVDGEPYLRYGATIDLSDLTSLAGSAVDGTAHADLWLRPENHQPYKVEIGQGSGRDAVTFTVEFIFEGEPIAPPERPADARPFRDAQLPDAPCTGSRFEVCLPAQANLSVGSRPSCDGSGRRVCLVPLGQVPPALMEHLIAYYREEYGLVISVLTPLAVPADIADPLRNQVDAARLIDYMGSFFPDAYADPQVVLIGLTPLDLYNSNNHFRYVFGLKGSYADPKAIFSTFRMNPETYSEPSDDDLLLSRSRKLLNKYVGLLYYGLAPSTDPRSPMYDSILSPDDLDAMGERLPVEAAP
jgi:predicted Zn-dependent protease